MTENFTGVEFDGSEETRSALTTLPFPPLSKSHILNCSYHSWHPRYRSSTPKARLIPLSAPFLAYLRSDGIVLPADDVDVDQTWSDSDSGIFSSNDADGQPDDEEDGDPAEGWRDIHESIKSTINELGGKVVPKLNWSAPKDATWISATNSMECRAPSDIYLLLKSSDFVTHDLEHAFDDCIDDGSGHVLGLRDIPYHLVLRKFVQLNPSLEFRCFVRRRRIIAICQRDLNHFEFLFKMQNHLRQKIKGFFDERLQDTFPDESFTFDVYIPPPHDRVWLIDINPWAMRTDPLLFSWLELLTMPDEAKPSENQSSTTEGVGSSTEVEEVPSLPVFRLIRSDDPEAYGFTTPQYSAHKLPKDVVDASRNGESQLREFANQWKEMLEQKRQEQVEDSEAD